MRAFTAVAAMIICSSTALASGTSQSITLLELAIDAATRVLATPGNFSDAAKWLIQLDLEQVLPDPP